MNYYCNLSEYNISFGGCCCYTFKMYRIIFFLCINIVFFLILVYLLCLTNSYFLFLFESKEHIAFLNSLYENLLSGAQLKKSNRFFFKINYWGSRLPNFNLWYLFLVTKISYKIVSIYSEINPPFFLENRTGLWETKDVNGQ